MEDKFSPSPPEGPLSSGIVSSAWERSKSETRLSCDALAKMKQMIPAHLMHLFGSNAQVAEITMSSQSLQHPWMGAMKSNGGRLNALEIAIKGTASRQDTLEITAKTIAQSLGAVLVKIDKIQGDQGRAIVKHGKVMMAQQKHQEELSVAAERTEAKQRQTLEQTQVAHGWQATTEDGLSQTTTMIKNAGR